MDIGPLVSQKGLRGEAVGPKCNSQTSQSQDHSLLRKRNVCTYVTQESTCTFNIYGLKENQKQNKNFMASKFNI